MADLQPLPAEPAQPPGEELGLGIAALSRATGLPIETLRTWERRYGFPTPKQREGTLRLYPYETLEHLKRIRDALDAGHRPSHVVPLPLADLVRLLEGGGTEAPRIEPPAAPRSQPVRAGRVAGGHSQPRLVSPGQSAATRLEHPWLHGLSE